MKNSSFGIAIAAGVVQSFFSGVESLSIVGGNKISLYVRHNNVTERVSSNEFAFAMNRQKHKPIHRLSPR